ncbi:hypothetical protein SORBI_3003G372850 [Sorghum bicolor]|uniref:Uncharacterized protein n=1 Tax=Sorghum bicolor TaxID=4558 RepID=A0A1W0W0Q3_SORBI|nr:hypothetical protein SORBI_3003G372850 [Sorghum bicolor]
MAVGPENDETRRFSSPRSLHAVQCMRSSFFPRPGPRVANNSTPPGEIRGPAPAPAGPADRVTAFVFHARTYFLNKSCMDGRTRTWKIELGIPTTTGKSSSLGEKNGSWRPSSVCSCSFSLSYCGFKFSYLKILLVYNFVSLFDCIGSLSTNSDSIHSLSTLKRKFSLYQSRYL